MARRPFLFLITSALPALTAALLVLVGCGGTASPPSAGEVVVYTSVDQVFSEPLFRRFEEQTAITVRAVFDTEETKSTGVLNRLIAEAQSPQADVFWSGDPVRPFLLIERDLIAAYHSPEADAMPAAFRDAEHLWTGTAARARVLLVNRDRLGDRPPPSSVRDLANPRFKGEAAIANPLFGTTTMHVAAWFASWGEAAARQFLDDLKVNQVRIASSNGEVRRLVTGGEVTFGLTDTDDASEALKGGAPVALIYPDQEAMGTLVMPTTVVLLRGGPHPESAKRLVDFLLSANAEQLMAENAAHMPLRSDVPLPGDVRGVRSIVPMAVDYRQVAAEMERVQPWLRSWVGL